MDRKARKEHICAECGETIKPNQEYAYHKALYNGTWQVTKFCLPCYRFGCNYCSHGWKIGELEEQVRECLGFEFSKIPPESEWDAIDTEDAARVEKAKHEHTR